MKIKEIYWRRRWGTSDEQGKWEIQVRFLASEEEVKELRKNELDKAISLLGAKVG